MTQRRQERLKGVLPVRVWGTDTSGSSYSELVHTLDVTPCGARLGAMHHELKPGDRLTLQYRQRKIEFRVVWTKLLAKNGEYQVGIEAVHPERDAWGLQRGDSRSRKALSQEKEDPTLVANWGQPASI